MDAQERAIDLLQAEQRGVEIAMQKLAEVFKTARAIHSENFDPMSRAPTMEDEAMTKLDDYRASISREIKRIQRRTRKEANEMRAKL